QKRNFTKWPVLGQYVWPNYYVGPTFSSEISYLKNWIKERLEYLDSVWGSPVSVSEAKEPSLTIHPVPADGILLIGIVNLGLEPVSVEVTDVFGRSVVIPWNDRMGGEHLEVDISRFSPGFYYIKITLRGKIVSGSFVIQR